jgi:hypothetical protein
MPKNLLPQVHYQAIYPADQIISNHTLRRSQNKVFSIYIFWLKEGNTREPEEPGI